MHYLGSDPRVQFLGQAVAMPGTAMSNTLKGIDTQKLIELPVAEEMQMGMSLGMAMNGFIPVTICPRWNFLLCAMNQLVNHVDKYQSMAGMASEVKVIIRTGIGSERPLNPQCQHVGDFTEAVQMMCENIEVIRLEEPNQIMPAYRKALERSDGKSTIVVEYGDYYSEK